MSEATYDTDTAATRCPVCSAMLEAYRVTRYAAAGGSWRASDREAWTAKCANGHEATKETLPAAVAAISQRRGR
ncbi:MAG TPA: hypothetical protein VM840_04335 [Actinomycetota bacterium]|nr:hypothetical protein [Actinomycetota bacterium]